MAVQLATLDILTEKGRFEPQVARAIGEAIETEIRGAQIVTVPMLDVRLSDLKSALDLRFMSIDARFAQFDARFAQLDARLDVKFAQLDGRFEQFEASLAKMENRLFLKMVGLGLTGIGVAVALLRLFNPVL